jgi:hypothetical protein
MDLRAHSAYRRAVKGRILSAGGSEPDTTGRSQSGQHSLRHKDVTMAGQSNISPPVVPVAQQVPQASDSADATGTVAFSGLAQT